MSTNEGPIYYCVDRTDTIVEIGGSWDRFAEMSGAMDLFAHKVIGTGLLSHISGDVTQSFVAAALDAARVLNARRVMPYRCDAPRFKRFMEMKVEPVPSGLLRVSHRLIRTERFPYELNFKASATGGNPTIRCSLCGRISAADGWLEPEEASLLGLVRTGDVNQVIYTVCEPCKSAR